MKVNYKVEGMTCAKCVEHISNAVNEVSPETELCFNLKSKTVTISGEHNIEKVNKSIIDAGYSSLPNT